MTSAFSSAFLTLTLTPERRPGYYTLVWGMGSHTVGCHPETDVMLGDLLRRLRPVLVGGQDMSGKLLPNELLHTVGIYLWQTLLSDALSPGEREALECELRLSTQPLILDLPPNLATLPWELLCDPQQPGETGFLARRRPLVRLVSGISNLCPLAPPLRILLLISSPPGLAGRQRIDIESERAAVENGTRDMREAGMLHLLVEDIVTPRRVQQALLRFKPHLLHYVGHADYDEDTGGYLLWEDDRGKPLQMFDTRLADLLRPRGLRAVLLHGCQTASSHASTDFRSVAGTLLNAGIPAVLAQQAGLTYDSSQRASEMFYSALTNGVGVAEATFEMRLALAQADRPDWAVSTLQSTIGGLLPLLHKDVPAGMPDPALVRRGATADLPAPTGIFVGRQPELRALRVMLQNAPGSGPTLALITGPGGVGKSTLAAQAIARYGGHYKGTLTLSCAGYQSVDLFLQRIAEFLQTQGSPSFLEQIMPDPKLGVPAKIEAAIAAFDQTGPCLLVVDNLESIQHTDLTLIDPHVLLFLQKLLLNLRTGRVLITGRYAIKNLLPVGKFAANVLHLDLDDLGRYEIHQLLTRHHLLEQLSETVRDELIREFGGLPYVYDVLSSKAARQNLTNLIHDTQGRITREERQRAATEWEQVRQQIIETAALDVVIQHLPEGARLLLAKLSLFRRPFPQQALEQGLHVTPADWQPLVEWALLRWNPVERTYRLHSLTAQYVATLLDTREHRIAQVQLAEWYLNYAVNTSHELADYLEAHALFRASGEKERAAEVAINLMPSLQKSGLNQIQHNLCVATIQDFSDQQGRHTAEALRQLGILAQQHGEYEKAKQCYHEAHVLFAQMNDEHGRSITLGELGTNAQEQGKYSEAQRFYDQALTLLQKLGDERGQATVLCHLGMMSQKQGEYGEAQRFYHVALTIFQHVGDESGCAAASYQLGVVAHRQGAYQEAQHYYESCLVIEEKTNDRAGKADTLLQLGMLSQEQREYAKARRLFDQALTLFEQLGNRRGRSIVFHNLGMLAQRQREVATARYFYHEALAIFERWGDQRARVSVLGQLGRILQDEGNCEEAQRLYDEALKIFEELNDQEGCATTLGQLGLLALQQADYATALRFAVQAATIHERLHSPQRDTALQTLLRIQTEIGDAAFAILWQQTFNGQPLPDLSSVDRRPYLLKVMMVFIQAQTPAAARRIIEAHPALLSTEAERLLEEMATMATQRDDEVDKMIEPKQALLSRCRQIGIEAAFAELHQSQRM